ncbi:MAG: hypothetical protein ACI8ZM_003444 [Crocinitomix sp.]
MKKRLKILAITVMVILGITATFVKIETNYNCCESPTVRWKFAIYCGECDDETGCHYVQVADTGILEYFGLKSIPCDQE